MKYKIIGIIVLIPNLLIAQYSSNYNWSDKKPKNITVDKQFTNSAAVILDEQNTIRITGLTEYHINHDIQKKYRVKILNKNGLNKFKTISVPESFDPLYDYPENFSVNVNNKNKISYYDIKMLYFSARIIKPNGKIIAAKFVKKPQIRNNKIWLIIS